MKKAKRIMWLLLALALVITILPMQTQAASPKLNKTSLTLKIGKSATLKVLNSSKKFTWTTSNKSVATVSKGKVTAKNFGSATITAKNGKTILKCKVKVSFSQEQAKKNISIEYDVAENETVAFVTNNNNYSICIDNATMMFYGKKGFLSSEEDNNNCIGPGHTAVLHFSNPYDDDYNYIIPDSYKLNYTVESTTNIDYVDKIKYSYHLGLEEVAIEVKNTSSKDLYGVWVTCLMYDENNNLIYSKEDLELDFSAGETKVMSMNYPYDDDYNTIVPDHCVINIDQAFVWKY